jgi:hypothetical protein
MERNKPCRCGSGKKYKKCHLYKDQGWEEYKLGDDSIAWRLPKKSDNS